MPHDLYRDFSARRHALAVQLQEPRLRAAWAKSPHEADPSSWENPRTETYLFLLIAHQFTEAIGRVQGYSCAYLTEQNTTDLRHLRNVWEHIDEKRIGTGFRWEETRRNLKLWLDATYPQGPGLAFSIMRGDSSKFVIGQCVDVEVITLEAMTYLGFFEDRYGH